MNLVRIYLIQSPANAHSYEEWTWQLEENYKFNTTDSELLRKRVERDGYYDGDRGFTKNFKWTFDLDSDFVKNDSPDALYLRIYKFLKRERAIEDILDK